MKRLTAALGLLLIAGAPAIASAAPGDDGVLRGRIQNAAPFNVDLQRGPHVTLRNGTVINPRGTTLQSGMRIVVFGHYDGGRGNFLADRVDVVRRHRRHGDGDRNNGYHNDGDHAGWNHNDGDWNRNSR